MFSRARAGPPSTPLLGCLLTIFGVCGSLSALKGLTHRTFGASLRISRPSVVGVWRASVRDRPHPRRRGHHRGPGLFHGGTRRARATAEVDLRGAPRLGPGLLARSAVLDHAGAGEGPDPRAGHRPRRRRRARGRQLSALVPAAARLARLGYPRLQRRLDRRARRTSRHQRRHADHRLARERRQQGHLGRTCTCRPADPAALRRRRARPTGCGSPARHAHQDRNRVLGELRCDGELAQSERHRVRVHRWCTVLVAEDGW
jgi:hypothetical protein